MFLGRRVRYSSCVVALSVCLVSCGGDPPDKEIEQAQGAVDAARAAGADRYARDEFVAAEDSLKHAHDAVGERDYRLALTRALDSRDRAETAAKEAADNRATARADATRALAATDAALTDLKTRAKAHAAAHAQPRADAGVRATVTAAERSLQKARAAFDSGDYRAVVDSLGSTRTALSEAARDASVPAPPATRRKH